MDAAETKRLLLDLVGVLFMATGKAGNSAKCQLPVFIKNVLNRDTLPRSAGGAKNRRVYDAKFRMVINMDTYMGRVANLSHSPDHQRELLDLFLRFVLNERLYLTPLWSLGQSYATLKRLSRGESLLSPFVVFQVPDRWLPPVDTSRSGSCASCSSSGV